jgi:transposase
MARYFGDVKALSLDLRERVAHALESGQTQTSIAQRFAVSLSSVERIAHKRRAGHTLEPSVRPGKKPLVETEQHEASAQVAASRTDWTLQTLAQAWQEQGGKALSPATTSRTLRRVGFSFKKSAALPKSEIKPNETPSARR